MQTVFITPGLIEWLHEVLNFTGEQADDFAHDFIEHLQTTGGLSTVDLEGIAGMSRDERLQLGADIKAQMVGLHNLLCALAVTFAAEDDAGVLAATMSMEARDIKTWANVYATLGPDTIMAEDKIDAKLWQAILDTGDQAVYYLERARDEGLGPTQIRRAAGVIKESKPPMYAGGAMVKAARDTLTVHLDSPTTEAREFRATVRVTERE